MRTMDARAYGASRMNGHIHLCFDHGRLNSRYRAHSWFTATMSIILYSLLDPSDYILRDGCSYWCCSTQTTLSPGSLANINLEGCLGISLGRIDPGWEIWPIRRRPCSAFSNGLASFARTVLHAKN